MTVFRILILLVAITRMVTAAEVKVFLLGGQSNALGRAAVSGLPISLQSPQTDVLYFSGKNGTVGTTLTTLRPDGRDIGEFGPEVTFGRAIADASPTTRYAIIKYAAGGTNLYSDWAPDTGSGAGVHYASFQQTVSNGLAALQAAGHTTEIVGMVWHQGESDALSSTEYVHYQDNLTAFVADVRSRYGANLPFLIGEIRREHELNGIEFQVVADAQIKVAGADPGAVFVPASDLTFSDRYHFNAPGQITLGERFAAGYAGLISGSPPVPVVSGFSNDRGAGPVTAGSLVSYTVTFSEDMHSPSLRAANFGNAGSSALGFGTITETSPGVFRVPVTPTTDGTLRLRINALAAVTSAAGEVMNTSMAILDPATINVSSGSAPSLVGELGILNLTANGGSNPATGVAWAEGDKYRFVFVTSTTRNTQSTNIADYNTHAQNAANASTLNLGGATWKVFGSTAAVAAKDNTGTAGGANTGEAVFLLDGSTVVLNKSGNIWNSNLLHAIDRDENLNLVSTTRNVATGTTQTTGVPNPNLSFGDEADGDTRVTVGNSNATSSLCRFSFNNPSTNTHRFYALSEPLTVQAAGAAVDPRITSFTSVGADVWELTLQAEPNTAFEFRSSVTLDFSPGLLVENLVKGDPGDPGTIGGTNTSLLTTDANGAGKVRVTLSGPKNFIRAGTPAP